MRNKSVMVAATLAAGLAAGPAMASDTLAKFEGGVGVHPVAGNSAAGAATVVNTVRGIAPGGRPWGILKLKATIKRDGGIRVSGEGLVLVGTDNPGSRGGVRQVVASLFCGGSGPFTSPPGDLGVGGDFEIRGQLDALPPNPCGDDTSPPTLLIRNFANGAAGAWFAAGIVDD
jgi:hypothetical protein